MKDYLTLADTMNGPDWIMYVVAAVFALMTITFLRGRGGGLIAGYNTMSAEEKAKYDAKKMCRGMGVGFGFITVLVLISGLFAHILPDYFAYIMLALLVLDVVVMIIWGNIFCKK